MSGLTGLQRSMMPLSRVMSLLQDRADKDECDGNCDEKPPHKECEECSAVRALNEASEIMRAAL